VVLQIVARNFSLQLQICSRVKDSVMRKVFYSAVFSMIVVAGLFIGMVKGQQVRHKWVAKMKGRQVEKKSPNRELPEIMLDEIEMSTYHS